MPTSLCLTFLSAKLTRTTTFMGYISNMAARFWGCPRIGVRLTRELARLEDRKCLKRTSDLGRTPGPVGPHEFGYFWDRWFGFSQHPCDRLDDHALKRVDVDGLREAVRKDIVGEFGAPVFFKNLCLGPQAAFVSRVLGPCLFVRMRRPLRDTVSSILRARKRMLGDYRAWWSLRPGDFPNGMAGLQAASSVVAQVLGVAGDLDEALACCNSPVLEVSHERLRDQPDSVVDRIVKLVGQLGGEARVVSTVGPLPPTSAPTGLPHWLVEAVDDELYRRGCSE